MRSIPALILVVLGLTLTAHPLCAQDPEQMRKLQLAQSLEQAGEWERAAALYEDLWRSDQSSYVYFDALRRAYVQLKQYDKAIVLVEQRRSVNPGEVFLTAQLGGLYFDSGRPTAADSIWSSALAAAPRQRQLYVIVAQQMQERRLYDDAVRTLLAGRAATKNPLDFVEDLALLYSARQQYAQAVEEYLRLLSAAPQQLGYVQSRIGQFTFRTEGILAARQTVIAAIQRAPASVPLRSLLAWLSMEQGDYGEALDQYRSIDKLANSGGGELYNFGQRALQEGAAGVAAAAFRIVCDSMPNAPLRPLAALGYARAMEELSADPAKAAAVPNDTATVPRTVRLYEDVIARYPGSDAAFQSWYRLGIVRYERLFDLDGALAALDHVRSERRAGVTAWNASLLAADVRVARNDLAGAREVLLTLPLAVGPDVRDRAAFRLAQLEYYDMRVDSALAGLQRLASAVDRDLANDAMGLQYLLLENKGTPELLASFARADLLQRQRKFSEALVQLEDLFRRAPQSLLADDVLMRMADAELSLGHPDSAIARLERLGRDIPESMYRDRAAFRIAEITDRVLHAPAQALERYEAFLSAFPHSLYAETARRRSRELRGDAL